MKTIFVLGFAALLALTSCQKQQTEAERRAEIDKQVEQRLAEEKQKQDNAQREADLTARERALADKERATPSPSAAAVRSSSSTTASRQNTTRSAGADRTSRSNRTGGSYDMFYTSLESHGDWLETDDYGYVWQPRQAQSSRTWKPYTDGRWVYTDAGWTWVSEESFGWATYHYGRWARIRSVGWVWVPGEEWAPAWVSWRTNNDYVGWAPLPPEARFDRETGIHKWADSYYDIGPENYSFVQSNQIGQQRIERVVVPQERNLTIVNQTVNVTNITYANTTVFNGGPNYEELRTRSEQPIERLRIEREVDFQTNDPRSVVRGEVISIPAPIIIRAEAVSPPPVVKKRVTQIFVERGWDAIADKQGAEQARRKVRADAPPPTQGTPPRFVKPTVAPAASPETPAATATATPSSTASASPMAAATASTTPMGTPTASPRPMVSPRRTSTPAPSATPAVTATPFATATPSATRRPSATASPVPERTAPVEEATATATPRPSATPRPTATVAEEPSATPSATPRASLSPRFTPRPTASPSATSTPAAESSPVGDRINGSPLNAREPAASKREAKAERKADKKERRFNAQSASETPASPQGGAAAQQNASGYATPIPAPPVMSTPRPAALAAEATPAPTPTPPPANDFRGSRVPRGVRNPPPSPSETATPSPAPEDAATDETDVGKKKRKRDKGRGVEDVTEASPTATPSPTPGE